MLFSSTVFVFIFLPAVLLGYYVVLRRQETRNAFLLLASLFFYAWGEPVYVFLMMASIAANYALGLGLERIGGGRGRKALLLLGLLLNLGILFHFKYLNFVLENLGALLGTKLSSPAAGLKMPIGISFFTFQALSYVIDVYRGTVRAQRNPLYLGLYISFFPQLIAGPIVRYNSIEQQIIRRSTDWESFQKGVRRFVLGFAKKILLANDLALVAERGFALAGKQELSAAMAWLGALAYTFQIYFDFSGYSDMAIGLGKMFGFDFEENFNFPYISRSVSEFWNRWHISLGHWFRDYLYFPLGGSRVSRGKLLRNLFAVWFVTGLWHGAAWQFIVWGLMYGVLVSFEKLTGIPRRFRSRPAAAAYGVLTFLIVNAGWVLFGAQSFSAAVYQLGAMLGIGTAGGSEIARFLLNEHWLSLLLAAILSTPLVPRLLNRLVAGKEDHPAVILCRALGCLLLLALSVSFLAMGAHNPFIYFTF